MFLPETSLYNNVGDILLKKSVLRDFIIFRVHQISMRSKLSVARDVLHSLWVEVLQMSTIGPRAEMHEEEGGLNRNVYIVVLITQEYL